jgi:hypothetical protein
MAGPAVMILHCFRAGSPVVTDTGCCLPAARHRPTLDLRDRQMDQWPHPEEVLGKAKLWHKRRCVATSRGQDSLGRATGSFGGGDDRC